MKYTLITTPELLKEKYKYEQKNFEKNIQLLQITKEKNVLDVLDPNTIQNFWWVFIATRMPYKDAMRLILADTVESVIPIYLDQTCDSYRGKIIGQI